MKIGIIGAMNEEVSSIISDMENRVQERLGVRAYNTGTLYGKDACIAVSGWGKVASASTAAALIMHYKVDAVLVFGVAGGAAPDLNIGDIIVANNLIQHDLDPSPIYPKYHVPLLGVSRFETDSRLRNSALTAADKFASKDIAKYVNQDYLSKFHIDKPAVIPGLIASGDQFISDSAVLAKLRTALPDVKCIEMEGASVAQVCFEYKTPIIAIRVISDKADHSAHIDFPLFVSQVITHYAQGIIKNLLPLI